MLHIGICDDNQKDISRVQELAGRFSEQHPEMPVQIQAYSSPYDLLDDIEKTGGFIRCCYATYDRCNVGQADPGAKRESRNFISDCF